MKCIILVAGKGTRMGELTKNNQKAMLEVDGKPKLAWSIENLPDEIDEVVLVVGYLQEQVRDFFGKEYAGKKITYVEQKDFNGTAGAIDLVKDLISEDEKFLVIMGDDFYKKSDLEKLLEYDYSALAFEEKENAWKFGVFAVNESNFLQEAVEKPGGVKEGFVSVNAFVLQDDYFNTELVPISDIEFGLPQTVAKMSKETDNKVKVIGTETWFAMGDPEAYKIAQEKYKEFID